MPACALGPAGRVAAGSLAALLLGAFVAAAQNPPLGEVARKEEERRKTAKPATKVLTNKDLPKVTSPMLPAPTEPQSPAPADAQKTDAAAPDKTDKDDKEPVKDEAWWRARIEGPRGLLLRDGVLLEALQSRVNALTSDFTARDDPYQRGRIADDRQKALVEMDRVRTEITDLKVRIADIEEEARKASVPPGWLR